MTYLQEFNNLTTGWEQERYGFSKSLNNIITTNQNKLKYIDELLDELLDDIENGIITKEEYKEQNLQLEQIRSETYWYIQETKHALKTMPH